MADALIKLLRQSLPPELVDVSEPYIAKLEAGKYEDLLTDPEAKSLLAVDTDAPSHDSDVFNWSDRLFHRLGSLLADRTKPEKQAIFFSIGYAALLTFLQANVTGPTLPFNSAELLFQADVADDPKRTAALRKGLLDSLCVDGIAPYRLTPNVELLILADVIFTCPPILKNVRAARWAKLRLQFVHQRLLSEVSSTLQGLIYEDLRLLEEDLFDSAKNVGREIQAEFLLERASIQIHHGFDKLAREDLERAKRLQRFEFALTGRLGKRTKFQQTDTSQLVVLAVSDAGEATNGSVNDSSNAKPEALDLNDDTLLERISFTRKTENLTQFKDEASLPRPLTDLDPSHQPQLQPLDSTILLALASSIKNTSPEDGLTREETLPYATRVIDGGSSNWQVYTQALLVRSRIEGYRSRTVERGLLQLQALVDQIIADTGGSTPPSQDGAASSFLPRPKETESAPAQDRLRYIFQLATPSRWDLEAELASRWVSLGGPRSALEIYERLEMWAEAALCWAATEREDKAKSIVRRQLYRASNGVADDATSEDEQWAGPPREPQPSDAPRLYCILGDIDHDLAMYERAWEVSGQRYARAQRSIGRHHYAAAEYTKAADAYKKSLKSNQLSHNSWFALGCSLLELKEFDDAVEAFSRCVQLDETDAESWSNLAAALLNREPSESNDETAALTTKQSNRQEALKALTRAASLKHDSYRIWQNVLIVSASLDPPDYTSVLAAQRRIAELRGSVEGEKCLDYDILEMLVRHVMDSSDQYDPEQPGLSRMVVQFIDKSVVPLVTSSEELWRLISKLALWRNDPSSALEAEEKAWRAVTSRRDVDAESESGWNAVVEATVRLCDAYESLGPRADLSDWKFKSRTAVRTVMGRGKSSFEGTNGWETLTNVLQGLRS